MMQKMVAFGLFFLVCMGSLSAQKKGSFRTAYDDSTLGQQSDVTLMPFNRWVRSAGQVITFGNPKEENHALDFAVMPDSQHIVVEERYGIAMLDVKTSEVVSRWVFTDSPATRSMM